MPVHLLPFLAPVPLLVSAAAGFLNAGPRPRFLAGLAQAAALLALAAALAAAAGLIVFGPGSSPVIGLHGVGLSARLDAVSAVMLLLVTFIGWVVVRYAGTYLDGEARQGPFTGWLCLTLAAVLLLVAAGNLVQLVAAWIATSLFLHRLLLFYPDRVAAQRAARKKFVTARAGDVALVGAAALLAMAYRTVDIAAILNAARAGEGGGPAVAAASLLALAAMLKSAQFPTHGWLTEVMETPTPVSALLHAGVINAGGFLLIRFADLLLLAPGVLAVLVMAGGFTALFGSLVMLTQPAVKTSLAWSTVAQMGFMIFECGLALFPLALLHIVAHSLYKAHSFLASGGAVERVAAIRRPGPVAIPGAVAVGRAFVSALVIYLVVGLCFGLTHKSPQAIALGAILIFGVAYMLAQGFADAAPRALTRRTAAYAVATSVGYFALQLAATSVTAGVLPPTPAPGPLQWALIVLAVISFGLVAIVQAMFPLWAYHPAAGGLRVHLSNGFYANAVFDRLVGAWSAPGRRAAHPDRPGALTMPHPNPVTPPDLEFLEAAADRAARSIPPVWPLASSVAVNPFLGQAGESLAHAGARLARIAGAPVAMPRRWYRQKISAGTISDEDLLDAWTAAPAHLRPADLAALKAAAAAGPPKPGALPTIADLAAETSGIDWPGLIAERLGAWAAGYFDEGQALWAAPRGQAAYAAWRAVATHDLTPEIAGLRGFALHVSEAPESAIAAIARVAARLGLGNEATETYFHQQLMTLGGWAQYARYRLWQAELAGGADRTITDLLAIRLIWEEALFLRYGARIADRWASVRARHAAPVEPTPDLVTDAILQEAVERSGHRALAAMLAGPSALAIPDRPVLQAAFCIDVRSEVFRRALESLNPQIRTLGFAGFFGLTTAHRRFASDVEELRLPVLLNPAIRSVSGGAELAAADRSARFRARARRAWGRFKLAAVSSFAFVEATGPIYVGKLVGDALALHGAPAPNDPAPRLDPGLDLAARTRAAGTVLRAMSLTTGFARLVLLAGHGASVVNNPHASGLHCGACGGYSGEVNARLLAALLNDPQVRTGLAATGIEIPADTLFVAALHDTTTDRVTLYAADHPAAAHRRDLVQAETWLAAAGRVARGERALRLPRAGGESSVPRRSRDWAETRPEWALAGCRAFIAAPRARTAGKNLAGRAFLHDYDWRQDNGFGVLELILTAPVVVASWISLQYYGSTVAPETFGGGNKLLHNVTGGIGVVEGNGGLLRAGLPWQSVHDGEDYAHEPVRLSVCIEAPREAMTDVLSRHANVRALFDNGWLYLFALDDEGRMAWRYGGNLRWTAVNEVEAAGRQPRLKVAV